MYETYSVKWLFGFTANYRRNVAVHFVRLVTAGPG